MIGVSSVPTRRAMNESKCWFSALPMPKSDLPPPAAPPKPMTFAGLRYAAICGALSGSGSHSGAPFSISSMSSRRRRIAWSMYTLLPRAVLVDIGHGARRVNVGRLVAAFPRGDHFQFVRRGVCPRPSACTQQLAEPNQRLENIREHLLNPRYAQAMLAARCAETRRGYETQRVAYLHVVEQERRAMIASPRTAHVRDVMRELVREGGHVAAGPGAQIDARLAIAHVVATVSAWYLATPNADARHVERSAQTCEHALAIAQRNARFLPQSAQLGVLHLAHASLFPQPTQLRVPHLVHALSAHIRSLPSSGFTSVNCASITGSSCWRTFANKRCASRSSRTVGGGPAEFTLSVCSVRSLYFSGLLALSRNCSSACGP